MNQSNYKSKVIETYSLLCMDVVCLIISYYVASYIRFGNFVFDNQQELYLTICAFTLFFCVIYTMIIGNSRNFVQRGYYVELGVIIKYNACMAVVVGCSLFLIQEAGNFARLFFGVFMIVNFILNFTTHCLLKKYLRNHFQSEQRKIKMMVITDGEYAEDLVATLKSKIDFIHEITSVIIWDQEMTGSNIEGIPVVAYRGNYIDAIKSLPLDEVFIYLPKEKKDGVANLIMNFEIMGIVCHYNIDMANLDTKVRTIGTVGGFTVVSYSINQIDYNKHMLKRLMDIAGGLVGLLITLIFLPFVAIAIKVESKGPVFFSQKRVGRNGRKFKIYKFRSMYADAEERKKELEKQNQIKGHMFKMENDPRITKVGKFLRKTSIDELPQFLNVLKGDMSLVGTRPPTEDEFEKYNLYYKRRLSMTPGLTGLWQVSGRSEITDFDQVVQYDLEYIDNWSLMVDIKILFQTIWVVCTRRGSK